MRFEVYSEEHYIIPDWMKDLPFVTSVNEHHVAIEIATLEQLIQFRSAAGRDIILADGVITICPKIYGVESMDFG